MFFTFTLLPRATLQVEHYYQHPETSSWKLRDLLKGPTVTTCPGSLNCWATTSCPQKNRFQTSFPVGTLVQHESLHLTLKENSIICPINFNCSIWMINMHHHFDMFPCFRKVTQNLSTLNSLIVKSFRHLLNAVNKRLQKHAKKHTSMISYFKH